MCYSIALRNTFHTKYLNLDVVPPGHSVRNIFDCLFVDLGTMDGEARCRVQFLVTDVTLEVLGLLVKYQYFVIVKFPVAVPVHFRKGFGHSH